MDTLPALLWKRTRGEMWAGKPATQTWQMILFADDVKVQAIHEGMMQRLFTAATEWATEYIMT